MKRRYNWKPDLPDHRDIKYGLTRMLAAPGTAAPLPSFVDMRSSCSPVEDQGDMGSCSGHAIAGALELLENLAKMAFRRISRLFVYYNERDAEGSVGSDSGAMLRDGVNSLVKLGAAAESLWPYSDAALCVKPDAAAYADAAGHKITQYASINNLNEMKHALANGHPVVFGFSVYDSFESDAVAANGMVPMPDPSENMAGGHAVCAVGYKDSIQCVIVRNSWGPNWGDQGYFYLPYAYVSNQDLADDFWAIIK